jgi:hypothetical protein
MEHGMATGGVSAYLIDEKPAFYMKPGSIKCDLLINTKH